MATKKEIAAEKAAKKAEDKAAKEAKKLADKAAKDEAKKSGSKGKVEHRHISELSNLDRENLETILRKEPSALDEVDTATLNARVAYLTADERDKYGI